MTTRKASCDWVRARLPLEMGPLDGDFGDGCRSPAGSVHNLNFDGRTEEPRLDIDVRDRDRIARHLADCTSCRLHRAELRSALAILATVAEAAPVESSQARSLWPALEQRIRQHEAQGRERATTLRPVGRGPLSTELRLLLARGRDAALEAIDAALDRGRDFLPDRRVGLRPGIVFGGLVAALVCGLIALQVDREQARNRNAIAQGTRPLIPVVSETQATVSDSDSDLDFGLLAGESDTDADAGDRWIWNSSPGTFTASSDDEGLRGSRSGSGLPGPLAQAEIGSHRRSSAAGAGTATTPASKFDYDLERGTPMAPDSRDAKPSY